MKIGIVGDLILSGMLDVSDDVMELLHSADLNIANLEAPFIKKGFRAVTGSGMHQLVNDCRMLRELNIRLVSLANNHMGDFGLQGIEYTREILEKNGIRFCGAGKNLEQSLAPAEITAGDTSIACWGFMLRYYSGRHFATLGRHGVPQLRRDLIRNALRASHADVKVLYNHWNQEYEYYPEPVCKSLAEEFSEHCDIITGSHPHCIQGIQRCNRALIIHSTGNFSIPVHQYHGTCLKEIPEISRESMVVVVTAGGGGLQYEVHPLVLNREGYEITFPEAVKKREIEHRLASISAPLEQDDRSYRSFYNRNKKRKLRFTMVRNERLNVLMLLLSFILERMLGAVEKNLALLLDKIGILPFIKKRLSRIIKYFQSIR